LFSDLNHPVEQRAATSQHYTTRELPIPTRVSNFIVDVHQNFFGARLQDVTKDLSR